MILFGFLLVGFRFFGYGFHDHTNLAWSGACIFFGIILQYTTIRWPRGEHSLWFASLYLLVLLQVLIPWAIVERGFFSLYSIYLYPTLVFFLLGTWRGFLASLLLGLLVVLQLALHAWNAAIFGSVGILGLAFYALFVAICFLISRAQEIYLKKLAAVAQTDIVTGLPNHAGFLMRLEAAEMRAQPFQLLMMDLDHFRRINLILGTKKADELLQVIAFRMCKIRSILDLSRHYGDSFVWIYEGLPDQVGTLCLDLQKMLASVSEETHLSVPLSASFGAARFPQDGRTTQELWSMAELALKKAKQEGRKQLRYFQPSDADRETHQGKLFSALEKAIASRQIQVHYQPKINLETGKISGMEALVRWNDPVLGYIPPMDFIPLAEQGGLINALSDLVNEKSIGFLGSLIRQGHSDLTLSINISPSQMLQDNLCVKLIGLCLNNQVPTRQVFLEVTEGMLVHPDVSATIMDLRENGFRLSLDDFGTGYSSLSYLHKFHFDELKVDKGFTDGLMRSEKERRIFETIVQLSHDLGLHTVIEGVEKHGQILLLQPLGTVQVQGWFFASAMPAERYEAFLNGFDFQTALNMGAR